MEPLDLFIESNSFEFQIWAKEVDNYIKLLTDQSCDIGTITRQICPDLWDEEIVSPKYVSYDRDWNGDVVDLRFHPLFRMYQSQLIPTEAVKFILEDFNGDFTQEFSSNI